MTATQIRVNKELKRRNLPLYILADSSNKGPASVNGGCFRFYHEINSKIEVRPSGRFPALVMKRMTVDDVVELVIMWAEGTGWLPEQRREPNG